MRKILRAQTFLGSPIKSLARFNRIALLPSLSLAALLLLSRSMVSAAADVSSTTSLTSAPFRKYFRPRFLSASVGPVMLAPRSA